MQNKILEKKIKICYVIDSLQIGGAEKLTLDVINNLNKNNFDITLITFEVTDSVNTLKEYVNKNIKIVDFHNFSFKSFNGIKRIYRTLRDFDIIHSCLERSNFYISILNLLFLKKKKIVISIHGINSVYIKNNIYEFSKASLYYILKIKYIQRLLFIFCNNFIAISMHTEDFMINKLKISPRKICTIYHGLDINEFRKKDRHSKNVIFNELKITSNDFVIGYVGRLVEGKGLLELLSSFINLSKKINKMKLLFIGNGNLTKELSNIINKNKLEDKCIMTGFIHNPEDYYQILNIHILPSYTEGLPISLLEAMYNRTVTLSSNVGGIPEVVKDGENGFLFPVGDFENMNYKIEYIYHNYDKMVDIINKAYKTIIDEFDLNKNIRNIENYFELITKVS